MKSTQFLKKKDKQFRGRQMARHKRKFCKRNKNKSHEFVLIHPPEHKEWKSWRDYVCKHCGKREYIVTHTDHPEWNLEKKINIVG